MTPLLKKLLIILGVALAFLLLYLLTGGNQDNVYDVSSMSDSELLMQSERILENTRKIRSLRIDKSLFTDSNFTSLVDSRSALPEIADGRQNPFAPVQ